MSYTYTPDGLPLRTTEASGAWKECVYDSSRRLVGAISSDGAQDAFFEHDAFGRIVFESNTVSQVSYSLDRLGLATNEVQTVDGVSVVLRRTSDEFGRQVSFARVGGIASSFGYTNGTHLASVLTPDASARYRFSNDWLDEGYEMTVGGRTFDRWTSHDWYRRGLVDGVWYAQGDHDDCIIYSYDLMGRPSVRNNDVFGYNARGEVVAATIGGQSETHAYNDIGTHVTSTDPFANTAYASNARNQYASIVRTADAAQEGEPVSVAYDADGSLTTFGPWTYAYDSGRRLTSVASNGVAVATMSYDAQGRRVEKVAADGTHRYFYDGWLLVYEHITHADSTVGEIEYVWGKDISGRRNGAAGIGGLLYLKRNGAIYVPYADAYGNILGYWDANDNLVASYTYNAFGKAIAQEGAMADAFTLRYSTKYCDRESGLYYYGLRYYSPDSSAWMTSDPIAESGGLNLYAFCSNCSLYRFDSVGCSDAKVIVEGVGPGWAGWQISLKGKTALRLSGELFYVTGEPQKGMWAPKSGSTSSLLIYRADNPKKVFRLDYHGLDQTQGQPAWHYNKTSGFGKIRELKAANHSIQKSAAVTGKALTIFKLSGKPLFCVSAAYSVYDVYKAEDKAREITKQIGGLAGALAGARLGAQGGAKLGAAVAIVAGNLGPQAVVPEETVTVPAGVVVGGFFGGLGGGIVGCFVGQKVTETVYDWTFTQLEKEEWKICNEQ